MDAAPHWGLMKLLHLLLLVYWLGADLGTFYASRFVADSTLTPAARAVAARIMLGVDMAPRVAMPLTLASGVHLAASSGFLPGGTMLLAVGWLVGLGWLAMVLAIHHWGSAVLTRVDFTFRVLLVAALGLPSAAALMGDYPPWAPWLALKLLAFAGTVFCGLMIRVHLKPFGPAYARLMREGGSAEVDSVISRSISRCIPWVVGIWALLVLAAAAGLHLIY